MLISLISLYEEKTGSDVNIVIFGLLRICRSSSVFRTGPLVYCEVKVKMGGKRAEKVMCYNAMLTYVLKSHFKLFHADVISPKALEHLEDIFFL